MTKVYWDTEGVRYAMLVAPSKGEIRRCFIGTCIAAHGYSICGGLDRTVGSCRDIGVESWHPVEAEPLNEEEVP
jgi:hypothetical protein